MLWKVRRTANSAIYTRTTNVVTCKVRNAKGFLAIVERYEATHGAGGQSAKHSSNEQFESGFEWELSLSLR